MKNLILIFPALTLPLSYLLASLPTEDSPRVDEIVRSDVAGSVTVESSFTEVVSVPGVEGAG
ncbi:hypothetical protein, partial [Actinomyces sp. HMSC065F12]|uniref:hypothetical protein n=1 Tax=Actinomyces sp. HMSC065F12 TaxID=1739479 RepID=UPI001D0C45DA